MKNKIELLEKSVTVLAKEKQQLLDEKVADRRADVKEESEIVALKNMISKKNREIIGLERRIAELTRTMASQAMRSAAEGTLGSRTVGNSMNDSTACDKTEEANTVESTSEDSTTLGHSVQELESFISLIRTISGCKTRTDVLSLCTCTNYLIICSGW